MEFALVLRELFSRKLLVALGLLIAAAAAILSVYRFDGSKLKSRSLQRSAATTQLFIDTHQTALGSLNPAITPLIARATVYANFMASPAMVDLIGVKVGLSGAQISAAGPLDPAQPRTVKEPTALRRNVQLTGETDPYRLEFSNDPNLPIIGVFAQAPTTPVAINLANAAASSLSDYVTKIQVQQKVRPSARVVVRQLGPASGSVVNGGISKTLFAIVFVAAFVLWCVFVLLGARFRMVWRQSRAVHETLRQNESAASATGSAAEAAAIAEHEQHEHGAQQPSEENETAAPEGPAAHPELNGHGDPDLVDRERVTVVQARFMRSDCRS